MNAQKVIPQKQQNKQQPFNQQQWKVYKKISRAVQRKDKPSLEQIKKMYPNMVQVDIPQQPSIDMRGLKKLLAEVYQKSAKDKYDPQTVNKKLVQKDPAYTDIYKQLRTYMTSIKCSQVIKKAVADKMAKKVSTTLGIPVKQAMCVILMDDFWQSVKDIGHSALSGMKKFYNDNKQLVHDFVYTVATTAFPQAAPIFSAVKAHYGGKMYSQDPYAIDLQYLQAVFGQCSSPSPRKQNHYMYQMCSKFQAPITTLSDGTAMCIISPFNCVSPAWVNNANFVPFVQVPSQSTTFPYNAAAGFGAANGPFFSQNANIMNYGVDYCRVKYINTQAAIQCKGKLISSFFYQPPNASFLRNSVTGLYNFATVGITDQQLLQNTSYFRRFSNVQCQKIMSLGSFIPEQNNDECIPVNQALNVGSQFYSSKLPFIIIKFTGCNASTTIGSVFVQIGISIQPVASMRTIYNVTPRGSYQGVYRAFKQARKMRIPLQWLTEQQASFLFKQHFSQIQFPLTFGQGRYLPLPFMQKLPQDQTGVGLCVRNSLKAIGVQNELPPYSTIADALSYTPNIMYLVDNQVIFYKLFEPYEPLVYFNYAQRHATAIQISDVQKFFTFLVSNKILSLIKIDGGYQPYPIHQMPIYQNNIKQVIKAQLIKGGIEKNPGPVGPTIQFVLQRIQKLVFSTIDPKRVKYLIEKYNIDMVTDHMTDLELRKLNKLAISYSTRYLQHYKILRRISCHCLDQLNSRTYDSKYQCMKTSSSQQDSQSQVFEVDVNDVAISLLKGGVQPNPGPIVEVDAQQDQPPQKHSTWLLKSRFVVLIHQQTDNSEVSEYFTQSTSPLLCLTDSDAVAGVGLTCH